MKPNKRISWVAALCWTTVLALPAGVPAPEPADDCVNREAQVVRDGGTNGVTSVFAADMDGDDDIDIVSASASDDKIILFVNDGTATAFTEQVITANARGATSVYGADLDGDGRIDLVSASSDDDTIRWFQNIGGSPTGFIERVITSTARNAASVYIADVDGDGDNDVLAASINDDTVAIYFNDTAGSDPGSIPSFTEDIVADFAGGANSVFAANIYLDPDPSDPADNDDLEVLSSAGTDNRIAWYERVVLEPEEEGQEPPVVYVERVIDDAAPGPVSVYAADLDGNTKVDVLSATVGDKRISWYRNDGADPPTFTKRLVTTQVNGPAQVIAVDLDGDTDVDVITASRTDGTVAWFENLGGGDFGNPTSNRKVVTSDAPGAAAVFAIDLDRDVAGTIDIVAGSSVAGAVSADDKIAWHQNDGSENFTEHMVSGGSVAPEAMLTVDVDGVGGLDVIAASSVDDTILWFANDGAEPPAFTQNLLTNQAPGAVDLFWADLDADGVDDDLVAALSDDDSIVWYENDGGFGDPDANLRYIAQLSAKGATSVFVIDLDDDDLPDVLSASADDNKIAWYKNLGGGDFGDPLDNQRVITTSALGAQAVFAADIDADGDVDVLAASRDDDSVRWFESDLADDPGPDSPQFKEHVITAFADEARDLVAADIDMDGKIDVVVASAGDSRVRWFQQVVDDLPPQIQDLEPGESVTCTAGYTVTSADVTAGSITGTVTAAASEGATDDDTLVVTLGQGASIDLAKSSDADSTTGLGATITYTYTVTNTGDETLTAVSVTDPHSGLSAIDCGGVTVLAPAASMACTATYVVTQSDVDAGSIADTGTVTARDPQNDTVTDSDKLTIVLGSTTAIDVAGSSDATAATGVDDEILFTFVVTNIGEDMLTAIEITDALAGLDDIACGEVAFNAFTITSGATRASDVTVADVDGDLDLDVAVASGGDDTIAWYQSDLLDDPKDPNRPPGFTERVVTTSAKNARAVAVADLGRSPGGFADRPDIVAGYLFAIEWHEGKVEEICGGFDATGDGEIDGQELSLMGGGFGESCVDPGNPTEWWIGVDYNGDCRIDGLDLAILTSAGVWGRLIADPDPESDSIKKRCGYTCP